MRPEPPRAWITGAAGLIGHYLLTTAARYAPQWQIRPLTRQTVDLLDYAAVERLFRQEHPALVIHCAALSRSPACQADPALAHRINVLATQYLAALSEDIAFVFFSSDLVFDGRRGNYTETDTLNPLSVYGETKAAAEESVLSRPHHIVLRTSLNAGQSPQQQAFNEQMLSNWQRKETLRLFTDEFRSPLLASATAQATWELINQQATGLFHVAGSERLSRWEIGQIIANAHPNPPPLLEPASLNDYPGAPRPADTSLNCAKAQARLSFPLPSFRTYTAPPH